MTEHTLKTDPEVFEASLAHLRHYEIRYDDRGYKVGDTLILKETEFSAIEMLKQDKPLAFTGRELKKEISHILEGVQYGLYPGYVILSTKDIQ